MPPDLREELRQTRPFASPSHETHLSILRTAALLNDAIERTLRPYGITGAQYNVLRILRGSPEGLCRNDVRDRMLTRMPDVTRLLDRMEDADLIWRARGVEDRRLVTTRLTAEGRRLVDELDPVLDAEHRRIMDGLDDAEHRTLVELLARIRDAV
jgi:DNA-binding MarR family transcriptional regulator